MKYKFVDYVNSQSSHPDIYRKYSRIVFFNRVRVHTLWSLELPRLSQGGTAAADGLFMIDL